MKIAWIAVGLLTATLASAAGSRLTNLSVRSSAGAGTETLIVGFSLGGSGSKPVLVRGIGPSLAAFNLTGFVADPQLRLFTGEVQLDQNEDWGGSPALAGAFASVGAFELPASSRDAALLRSLTPGSYSAHLVAGSGAGLALVECYDPELGGGTAYFTNVSARSVAGTGASILTVGFAVAGSGPKAVLIRGAGPALAAFGLPGLLSNPQLRLFDAAGIQIGDNDNWVSSVTPPALFASVGAFALPAASSDAVLFLALPAGTYTAQVSGVGSAPGAALIEVYEVENSPVAYVTMQPVENPAAEPPADPGAGTVSAGPDVNPAVTFQGAPSYPFELRRAGITGEARIDFYVKTDGTVANAVALRASDYRLADAALAAVRTWRFVPGRRNGRLVTTHMQVPIIFTLN